MDVITLLAAVLVNALLMLLALAVSVGVRARGGLQAWQMMLLGQALGFGLLIAATQALPLVMATLGVMALSGSASAMVLTSARFLSLPVNPRGLWLPPLLLGIVHVFLFPDLKQTTGATNLTISLQIGWASWLLLKGAGRVRWRWLCGGAALGNAVLTFARGVLVLGWPEIYPRFLVPHPINISHLMLLNASLVLGTMGFLLAHRDAAEQALVRLASLDNLTGLLNRREWMQRAGRALGASSDGAVLLMLDLDHFKRINDVHGHRVGDEALMAFASAATLALRESDTVGRWGGEEFLFILPNTSPTKVLVALDRLRAALQHCSISSRVPGLRVAFSAGVAQHDLRIGIAAIHEREHLARPRDPDHQRIDFEKAEVLSGLGIAGKRPSAEPDHAQTGVGAVEPCCVAHRQADARCGRIIADWSSGKITQLHAVHRRAMQQPAHAGAGLVHLGHGGAPSSTDGAPSGAQIRCKATFAASGADGGRLG